MKQTRLVLILGKFPVTEVSRAFRGWRMKVQLGGTTTATFENVPDMADVRVGDLLTLYTEVLTKEHKQDAKPNQPPIQ